MKTLPVISANEIKECGQAMLHERGKRIRYREVKELISIRPKAGREVRGRLGKVKADRSIGSCISCLQGTRLSKLEAG